MTDRVVLVAIDSIHENYPEYIEQLEDRSPLKLEDLLSFIINESNIKTLNELEESVEDSSMAAMFEHRAIGPDVEDLSLLVSEIMAFILEDMSWMFKLKRQNREKWYLKSVLGNTLILVRRQ